MTDYRSLNHTRWTCQYHVVFIPKYRKKVIYGELRPHLGEVLRRLAQRRESEVEEGHLMVDHVHLILSIPPKYSVAQVVGYIKGKSAIHIARHFAGRPRNYVGQHFWVYPGFPTLFWGLSGFFVNDLMGKALWSSWKTRSVFQGAVGAFCASTAPSASTGPICMRQDRCVLGLQSTRE